MPCCSSSFISLFFLQSTEEIGSLDTDEKIPKPFKTQVRLKRDPWFQRLGLSDLYFRGEE